MALGHWLLFLLPSIFNVVACSEQIKGIKTSSGGERTTLRGWLAENTPPGCDVAILLPQHTNDSYAREASADLFHLLGTAVLTASNLVDMQRGLQEHPKCLHFVPLMPQKVAECWWDKVSRAVRRFRGHKYLTLVHAGSGFEGEPSLRLDFFGFDVNWLEVSIESNMGMWLDLQYLLHLQIHFSRISCCS